MNKMTITSALTAAVLMCGAVSINAKDIFDKIASSSQVESTYVSGRYGNRSEWKTAGGEAKIRLHGFNDMYTYTITDENVAKEAKQILDDYVSKNPDVQLNVRKVSNSGRQVYEYYYKYGEGDRVYQAICWYAMAPNNVEVAVVNWEKGYGYTENKITDSYGLDYVIRNSVDKVLNKSLWDSVDLKGGPNNEWKQATRSITLQSGITSVANYSNFDIRFIRGDKRSITVSGTSDEIQHLLVSQNSGCLSFKSWVAKQEVSGNGSISTDGGVITITSPDITTFLSYGTGDITFDKWRGGNFNCQSYGMGDMNASDIQAESITVRNNGTGDIKLGTVKGKSMELFEGGTGDINVKSATVDSADIMLAGTGDIICNLKNTGKVYATNAGLGDMTVRGTCETASINNTGKGDVDVSGLKGRKILKRNSGTGEVSQTVRTEKARKR